MTNYVCMYESVTETVRLVLSHCNVFTAENSGSANFTAFSTLGTILQWPIMYVSFVMQHYLKFWSLFDLSRGQPNDFLLNLSPIKLTIINKALIFPSRASFLRGFPLSILLANTLRSKENFHQKLLKNLSFDDDFKL